MCTFLTPRDGQGLPTRPARCSGCGRTYDLAAWSALELIQRLDAVELECHLTTWPRNVVVEARACAGCRRAISRLALRGLACPPVRDDGAAAAPGLVFPTAS